MSRLVFGAVIRARPGATDGDAVVGLAGARCAGRGARMAGGDDLPCGAALLIGLLLEAAVEVLLVPSGGDKNAGAAGLATGVDARAPAPRPRASPARAGTPSALSSYPLAPVRHATRWNCVDGVHATYATAVIEAAHTRTVSPPAAWRACRRRGARPPLRINRATPASALGRRRPAAPASPAARRRRARSAASPVRSRPWCGRAPHRDARSLARGPIAPSPRVGRAVCRRGARDAR